MKIIVVWDMMPYSLVERYQSFGGICCFRLQGRKLFYNLYYYHVHEVMPLDSILTQVNFDHTTSLRESQDSSVGIATGYVLDGRGSFLGRDKRFFSSP
jgi:hypothetical protein